MVRSRGDLATPLGRTPPRSVTGLIHHLEETSALSEPERPGDQGTIEVQTLRGDDGRTRHVVYLPGTDDITTPPWNPGDDVRDLPADLREIAGRHTAHAAGIRQAMRRAGIGPHDPVLLVGHSLGGMTAATLLGHRSGFDITHVVTAGSPIAGSSPYPQGTHVLSLENRGDVVPLLDGHDNPDSVQQVTVQFDDQPTGRSATLVGAHALRHYVHGAAAVDVSRDASVREQVRSLHAAGFLGARHRATSQVFQIER